MRSVVFAWLRRHELRPGLACCRGCGYAPAARYSRRRAGEPSAPQPVEPTSTATTPVSSPTPSPSALARDPALDARLARAAAGGDVGAQSEFVERMRCVPRILAVLNARSGQRLDEHDLADLAQDTLVLLWRKLETFTEQSTLETWAYGVARYEFLNARRRRRPRAIDVIQLEPESTLREEAEGRAEPLDHGELFRALDALGSDESRVIRMKHLDELTFAEIGAALALSTNTAKTRYYRGLQKLQQRLRAFADDRGTP